MGKKLIIPDADFAENAYTNDEIETYTPLLLGLDGASYNYLSASVSTWTLTDMGEIYTALAGQNLRGFKLRFDNVDSIAITLGLTLTINDEETVTCDCTLSSSEAYKDVVFYLDNPVEITSDLSITLVSGGSEFPYPNSSGTSVPRFGSRVYEIATEDLTDADTSFQISYSGTTLSTKRYMPFLEIYYSE